MNTIQVVSEFIGIPAVRLLQLLALLKERAPEVAEEVEMIVGKLSSGIAPDVLAKVGAAIPEALLKTLRGEFKPVDSPGNII